MPVKFENDLILLTSNLANSRLDKTSYRLMNGGLKLSDEDGCLHFSKWNNIKSSKRVLLQQNHKHTWNNTETETHLGLFASYNLGLSYIAMTSMWRQQGKYGRKHWDGTVTVGPQPSQAALKVIMLKTSHATSDGKADTTPAPSAPVNKNNAKHYVVKVS